MLGLLDAMFGVMDLGNSIAGRKRGGSWLGLTFAVLFLVAAGIVALITRN